jgi:hypothetical protein
VGGVNAMDVPQVKNFRYLPFPRGEISGDNSKNDRIYKPRIIDLRIKKEFIKNLC